MADCSTRNVGRTAVRNPRKSADNTCASCSFRYDDAVLPIASSEKWSPSTTPDVFKGSATINFSPASVLAAVIISESSYRLLAHLIERLNR
jgi:hypothetical protein